MEVRHFGIPVNDIDDAKKTFLKQGFKCIYDKIEEVRVIKMQLDESIVEFLEFACVHNVKPHVAFTDYGDYYMEVVNGLDE